MIGLTVHVRRAFIGFANVMHDLLAQDCSVLVVGPRGSGKTTFLRDAARVMSLEEAGDVLVVDGEGEIGGSDHEAHDSIGLARRATLSNTGEPYLDAIESLVRLHLPKTLVLDELDKLLAGGTLASLRARCGANIRVVGASTGTFEDLVASNAFGIGLRSELSFDASISLPGGRFDECNVIVDIPSAVASLRNGTPCSYEVRQVGNTCCAQSLGVPSP